MTKHLLPLRQNTRAPLFGRGSLGFPLGTDMDRLFDGLLESVFNTATPMTTSSSKEMFRPTLNVLENETAVTVELEVPGMAQEELDVTFVDGVLTVKGEKQQDFDEEKGTVHYVGRSYGSFEQRIPIRTDIDIETVEATVKNGVLSVRLPKLEEEKERIKKIEVR